MCAVFTNRSMFTIRHFYRGILTSSDSRRVAYTRTSTSLKHIYHRGHKKYRVDTLLGRIVINTRYLIVVYRRACVVMLRIPWHHAVVSSRYCIVFIKIVMSDACLPYNGGSIEELHSSAPAVAPTNRLLIKCVGFIRRTNPWPRCQRALVG